ncbi:MAG: DinB family protein [Algoriphagus aquaeductus]|uniref:DinB family protein n=1 Tax=Algoriphagus aquaeductus TaxID=475299 RepID=UPI00387A080C
MNLKEINLLFQRDLSKLEEELRAYQNEAHLWMVGQGISNSAGNLALHLFGNLRHFIGLDLGGIAYERNREREFAHKEEPREALLQELSEVKGVVEQSLLNLHPDRLGDMSLHAFFGHPMTIGYFLIHLYGHFNYHLGQINYHRRLLDQ